MLQTDSTSHNGHFNYFQRRWLIAPLLTLLLSLGITSMAFAATITVDNAGDGTTGCTLREAIANANSDTNSGGNGCVAGSGADTIDFAAALTASSDVTITLTTFDTGVDTTEFGPTALYISSTITILGPSGSNGVIIQRDSTDTAKFRLFHVTSSGNLTLENLTLKNGLAQGGNGANSTNGSSSRNPGGGAAGLGGAIYNQGTLTVRSSTLTGNSAIGGNGGGKTTSGSNNSTGGGGVGADASSATGGGPNGGTGGCGAAAGNGGGGGGNTSNNGGPGCSGGFGGGGGGGRSSNNNNYAGGAGGFGGGGGGARGTAGTSAFGGGTGGGNSSNGGSGGGGLGAGGAIFNNAGTVTISNTTLFSNTAKGGSSGNIASGSNANSGNGGNGHGGALFNRNGSITIVNSTLSDNAVAGGTAGTEAGSGSAGSAGSTSGGALYNYQSGGTATATLHNTILANSSGGNDAVNNSGTINGTLSNIVETSTGFPTAGSSITFSTGDPALSALAENGGPTLTQAIAANSVALDAGNNANCPAVDQRGVARPFNSVCDIGAYERSNNSPVAVDDSYNTNEDTTLTIAANGVLGNDSDNENDTLAAALVTAPLSGILSLNSDGGFIYTPTLNFNGEITFTYTATDTYSLSNLATVTITINAVNDAPSFSAGSDVTVNEDAGAQTVNTWATAISAGPTNESAQILSFNVVNDNNALFSAQPAVNPANGDLTFTPATNLHGSALVTVTLSDDGGTANGGVNTSAEQSFLITVTSVNDAPVAVSDSYNTNEDSELSVTAPGVLLNDADVDSSPISATLVSAPLPAQGLLALESDGSFVFTPTLNFNGTAIFTYTVTDEASNSNPVSVTITVDAVNDVPVAVDDSYSVNEDTLLTVNAITGTLGNDTDVENSPLTATLLSDVNHGVLTFAINGSFVYTPDVGYFGSDDFTYKANDGELDSNSATVTITVHSVNDAPVVNDQSTTTNEDTPVEITFNAGDAESTVLIYTITTAPQHGAVGGSGDTQTYTPTTNYNGVDSFVVQVCDDDALPLCDSATVTVTISAVNDAPVVDAQGITIDEDVATAITLTGSDVDAGDVLTYSVVLSPSHGTLSGTAPNLTYTPDLNYHGTDNFTFHATDGSDDSNEATVAITITAVNDAPVANNQSKSTLEDTSVAITLTASDVDGDGLTYAVTVSPTHGTLGGVAPSLLYTPDTNYTGSDSFSFTACDPSSACGSGVISLSIGVINDPPVAQNGEVTTSEDSAVAITLLATDAENNPLTYSVVLSPSHGSLSGTAPDLTYTPAANFNGNDSFSFKTNDGLDDSNEATVAITVTAVNDAPVANSQSKSTLEDTSVAITLTGSDVENDLLSFSIVTPPANGSLSGSAPNLIYTPNANYHGSDSFTFKTNDGQADSTEATVTLTINSVNDAPVVNNQSLTMDEDTSLEITLNASDVESAPLNYSVTTAPEHGVVSGDSDTMIYTPTADYNGSDSFVVQVCDDAGSPRCDSATIEITVTPINDAPTATDQNVSTNEDTTVDVTLAGEDVDNDSLSFSFGQPSHGTLSGTAPDLTYTPAENYNGSDSFTFTVNDGQADSNPATVSIAINAVNDTPVANDQTLTTKEDTARTLTLTGNDSDGDTLTFSIVSQPSHGTLSGTAPDLTYTPDANYTGADSITFNVCDPEPACDQGVISLNVGVVNDAPSAQGGSFETDEDTAVDVLLVATDVDGDSLSYTVLGNPSHGTLSGTAPHLVYTPDANFNGTDSFSFHANDGLDDSNLATVEITVNAVNDPPVANGQSVSTEQDKSLSITLTGTDVDSSVLTYIIVAAPPHGTLSGSAPNLTYTPNAGYSGLDNFTFKVNDGTTDSNPVIINITISSAPAAEQKTIFLPLVAR